MSETPKLLGLAGALYQEHEDGTITLFFTPAGAGTVYRDIQHPPVAITGGTTFTSDQQGGA